MIKNRKAFITGIKSLKLSTDEKKFLKKHRPWGVILFLRNIKKEFMTKEDLIISLQKIVKPYVQDQNAFNNLSEETDFINDLKINSANLVDVILDVEDEFDIEIDNDSMEKMLSVKAAVEIIETKLSAS